jgi:cation/acetate symporter
MLVGLGVTLAYMALAHPWLHAALGLPGEPQRWWGIDPIAAGVFGVPAGAAALVLVSLLTPAPSAARRAWVRRLRSPGRQAAREPL